MKHCFLFISLLCCWMAKAQRVESRLAAAYSQFESDSQLRTAIASLYVIDASTGKVIFDKNSRVGLAPASTQKIITAATALDVLGTDYRYVTEIGYQGKIKGNNSGGAVYIRSSGDPTLGSWRWGHTTDTVLMDQWIRVMKQKGVGGYTSILINEDGWEDERIPDGWIWQDIGNYYGAGASGFNWRENQFDILLQSGAKPGDLVRIAGTEPRVFVYPVSQLKTAPRGTGDNAYVYYPLEGKPVVRGTIPAGESRFRISAAMPIPLQNFVYTLGFRMAANGMGSLHKESWDSTRTLIDRHYSPALDSIVFWFLRKSINLYGEALIKTLAYKATGRGATQPGVKWVKNYWKERGIPGDELNITDGSGLSPLNRVTTHAQVEVLKYARSRSWFNAYYQAFPEFNGMKMKSGTINGAKGFCGYQPAGSNTYIFSFLVNNYYGSAAALVQKMYAVLDVLKQD